MKSDYSCLLQTYSGLLCQKNKDKYENTLLCLSLFFLVSGSFGQSKSGDGTSQDQYLLKSTGQKKTGWIFLGSGAALFATGLILPTGEYVGPDPRLQLLCTAN
jgi:hypothetical protein